MSILTNNPAGSVIMSHQVRLGSVVQLRLWHKFKLISYPSGAKWEYCRQCAVARNALGIAGADTPWVMAALSELPEFDMTVISKDEAKQFLEAALLSNYEFWRAEQ